MVRLASGLLLKNFSENEDDKRILDIKRGLLQKEGVGVVQLLVHPYCLYDDHYAGFLDDYIDRALQEDFMYVVHAPHEGQGVDLGETLDEKKVFRQYREGLLDDIPKLSWHMYNIVALSLASYVQHRLFEKGKTALDLVVVHPGYLQRRTNSKENLIDFLVSFESDNIGLETVPTPAVEANYDLHDEEPNFVYWGMGGTPKDMKKIIEDIKTRSGIVHKPVLDFTHMAVTFNNMSNEFIKYFSDDESTLDFSELVRGYMALSPWRFVHISGYTEKPYDEHTGFISGKGTDDGKLCLKTPDWFLEVVKDTLLELERKNGEVIIALELDYNNLESSLRQVNAFRKLYLD